MSNTQYKLYIPTCTFEFETWGPHEGCKEFMSEPDVWLCGSPADVRLTAVFYDHATSESFFRSEQFCQLHLDFWLDMEHDPEYSYPAISVETTQLKITRHIHNPEALAIMESDRRIVLHRLQEQANLIKPNQTRMLLK